MNAPPWQIQSCLLLRNDLQTGRFWFIVWVGLKTPPLPVALLLGQWHFQELGRNGRCSVSPYGKEEGLSSLGQSLTISSQKESASPMNNRSCYSSLKSSWSGSLFRMISIPWVFGSKSVWLSFLPFVIPVFFVQSDLDLVGDSRMNGKKPINCLGNDGHMHCVLLKSHFPFLCCFPAHSGVLCIMSFRDRKPFINSKSKQTAITRKY